MPHYSSRHEGLATSIEPNTKHHSQSSRSKKEREVLKCISVLHHTSDNVKHTAKGMAINGYDPSWQSGREERKRKVMELNQQNSVNDENFNNNRIHEYIRQNGLSKNSNCVTPSPKSNRKKRKVLEREQPTPTSSFPSYPTPKNGAQFEVMEALEHLKSMSSRNPCVKYWISKGWIPVSARTVTNLYHKYSKNPEKAIHYWKKLAGNPLFVEDDEFETEVRIFVDKDRNRAITEKDVEGILQKLNRHKEKPSRNTIKRYMGLAQTITNRKLTTKAQPKGNHRYAAEQSIRTAISYAVVHTISAFTIGKRHTKTKPIEAASKGAQTLYNRYKQLLNCEELRPVLPGLITSTDDSTVYAFEGTGGGKKACWKLVEPSQQNSRRSTYFVDEDGDASKMFSGQRVRLTVTTTAAGRVAPVFATISGLEENELPASTCPSGILCVEIPGLCCGASNVFDDAVGYVCFVRKMKSTANLDSVDKRIFLLYNEKVYYPFIAKIREKDYRLGEGQAVPEELKTVAWCDGGMPQLQAIISESLEEQDKTSNIERDKHAASASAVQQPADIQALFRSLKQLQKITSASDTYNADLADFIADVLKHQTALSLETKKMKAVLDFLGCLPSMLSKLCLAKHVTPGFTEAGMIDERSKQYPDVEKMINTCKRMDIDKMGIFWKHFDELFKCAMEHGMVTEDMLNKLGIPDDLDATGKVIKRDAGITQEHLQRAKSLSHAHQSMLRKEKQQMILDTLKTKLSTKKSCIQTYIDSNKECEKKLYQEMKLDEDTYDASYLAHASPQLFSKCTMKQLKAFIHCRKSKDEKKYPDKIPNLKANYVAAAWDLRTSPIIIKLPTQAEENEYLHAKKLNPQVTHVTALRHAVYQQSSITLRNVRLVLYCHNNYRGANFLEHTDVDIQHHDQADCLTRMLGGRLESHIVRKIATSQHDHYCLRLMKDNLGHMHKQSLVCFYQVKGDGQTKT